MKALLLLVTAALLAGGLAAQTPDIQVQRAAINVNNGGTDRVGNSTGVDQFSVTYTIQNTGGGTLTLTGGTPITGSNAWAVNYTINPPLTTTIGAGMSTTFVLDLDPNANGYFSMRVNIASDDPDENPYTFTVEGDTGTKDKKDDDCSTGTGNGPGAVMLLGLLSALVVGLRLRTARA
ncbi:MAG: hypothetical protein KF754_05230 [Planctomycetes bacterium]|nr:hypothetical protein [Planctomycetota bacterium]